MAAATNAPPMAYSTVVSPFCLLLMAHLIRVRIKTISRPFAELFITSLLVPSLTVITATLLKPTTNAYRCAIFAAATPAVEEGADSSDRSGRPINLHLAKL